ncbi:MAG: adenylate/guanylate cyclase domain-containing protein, partial [Spirochaetales bacterium]|nr:adenylate/guanylate cyclase domain-containing protein [Spirochaetales bacterium]
HYLAPEVINELIEDPERIGVGGREETLTALFTDITGFSRVSEILGTADLVSLLNEYLTAMSDVILDHRGTIDKYEGDAIMAFFGAPVRDENHAEQACRSAIQMKKLEALLNDRMIRNGTSPQPLLTRIGINSGPMIVGNLGTTRRLNYTIMGPAVNLASRLEGVNKPYRTAICIGEHTRELLPEGFLLRRMDRVRVKGTDEPVRLYELIGYGDESSAPQREALELFERGLADFEMRSWETAARRFETVLRIYPDDGPATLFLERCREFMEQEPRDTWDGVISLTAK